MFAVVTVGFAGAVSAGPRSANSQEEERKKDNPEYEERQENSSNSNSENEVEEPQDENPEDSKKEGHQNNDIPKGDEQPKDIQFGAICIWGVGFCGSNDPKPPTDTGYKKCGGYLLNQVGITYRAAGTRYDTIHVVPTRWGRLSAFALTMYTDIHKCMNKYNLKVNVRSWDSIKQQFLCHLLGQLVGGGSTWDLEGYRDSNELWLVNPSSHQCNW